MIVFPHCVPPKKPKTNASVEKTHLHTTTISVSVSKLHVREALAFSLADPTTEAMKNMRVPYPPHFVTSCMDLNAVARGAAHLGSVFILLHGRQHYTFMGTFPD
jgi:hypothetical protein